MLREKGTFGAVDIQYEVRHPEWYPTEMKGTVTVPDKQSQVIKHLIHTIQVLKLSGSNFIQGVLLIKEQLKTIKLT